MISAVLRSNNFGKLKGQYRAAVRDAINETIFEIDAGAKERVPYKTGHLRRSIQARMLNDGQGVVDVTAEYAARIEYGFNGEDSLGRNYSQAAQPYLTPAAEAERRNFPARIQRRMR